MRSRTLLRLKAHSLVPDAQVIEIWHDGQFIGEVTGADPPGLTILSKHGFKTVLVDESSSIKFIQVIIAKP